MRVPRLRHGGYAKLCLPLVAVFLFQIPVPSATASTTPIKHIVIIMQENQTFDHFFGTFPGLSAGYGFPLNQCLGTTIYQQTHYGYPKCIRPFSMDAKGMVDQEHGLDHSGGAALKAYSNGSMKGFIKAQGATAWANLSVSYLANTTLPTYWSMASYYALDANFFSSAMSYSYPNHLFLATPTLFSGCTLLRCKPEVNLTLPNIVTTLNATGINWKYFAGSFANSQQCQPVSSRNITGHAFWNVLPDWPSIQSSPSTCHRIQSLSNFWQDLSKGHLPQVSWVMPVENESDHPGCGVKLTGGSCSSPKSPLQNGQAYVANIVNAISQNQTLYRSTAIFITWDDWGGYYDNVVPRQVDRAGYGFRVPLIVVSPYVKNGIFYGPANQQQDFTAFMATIEHNWNLPPVGARDSSVGDLLYMFNFSQPPRPPMIFPPPKTVWSPVSDGPWGCLSTDGQGDPCD